MTNSILNFTKLTDENKIVQRKKNKESSTKTATRTIQYGNTERERKKK